MYSTYLVLAECVSWEMHPAIGNYRSACAEVIDRYKSLDPWFGFEQEYTLMKSTKVGESSNSPYGFNKV